MSSVFISIIFRRDNMTHLHLKLKLVTPLLMFGAYNGGHRDTQPAQPEIRPASIRGGLRYWLRAVYGAAYGSNIEGLHEAESRIFGSTSRGSAITVRVQHSLQAGQKRQFVVLPERVDSNNGKTDHKIPGFQESGEFDLHLIAHPLRRDVFMPALTSALLLAFTLGGFGKRARRGGGALQIVGLDGDAVPSILHPFKVQNGAELVKTLKESVFPYIERAVTAIPGTPYAATAIPAYPLFAPDHCRIFVGTKGENGYLAALKQIWSITGAYHRVQALDRQGKPATREKNGNQEPVLDRWAWGYAIGKQRRASALHMRVFQCGDGKYYPIVTIFRGGQPEVNTRNPNDENQKWDRVQEVIDLFDDPKNNFTRTYGNTTRW
jgi:CRISPR-associated protein Cmr1